MCLLHAIFLILIDWCKIFVTQESTMISMSYYKMFSAGKDAASVLVLVRHVDFESTRQSTEKGEGPAM